MLSRPGRLVVALLALLATSCVSNPDGGCPQAGIDSPRRCKRMCVLSSRKNDAPLPCTCDADCLCWKMAGHSTQSPVPTPELGREPLPSFDLAR